MQPTTSRKTAWEMAGEFLREAAVLVFVFGLLEPFVAGKGTSWEQAASVLFTTILGLTAGIWIELKQGTAKPKETEHVE